MKNRHRVIMSDPAKPLNPAIRDSGNTEISLIMINVLPVFPINKFGKF